MGRPALGWRLRRKGAVWCVRFTAHGRSVERSTGERDRDRAASAAARIYSHELRHERPQRLAARAGHVVTEAIRWLTAEDSLRDPETNATYALYARTHWAPFFRTVDAITEKRIAEYRAHRLTKVAASTVAKELIALRAFCRWAKLGVVVPGVPRRAIGRPDPKHWKGTQAVSMAEAESVLALLPSPARERYTVALETSLRPSTLDALRVPEHWRPGSDYLTVTREDDKARDGRPLPLTPRAVRALAAVKPAKDGRLFRSRHRKAFKAAAIKALGQERGSKLVPMDLRASRITAWLEETANLPGTQYLAGHKQATTTARYAKPTLRAALEVLGKVSGKRKKRRKKPG